MDGANLGFLLMVGAFLLVVVIGLSLLALKQSQQLKELQKPKYGFLGKPLYSFVAILMMFGVVSASYIFTPIDNTNQFVTYVLPASEIQFELEAEEVIADEPNIGYRFNIVPVVDEIAWGGLNIEFDVLWEVTREAELFHEYLETGINDRNPGGFELSFPRGSYSATATVSYQGELRTLNFFFDNQ